MSFMDSSFIGTGDQQNLMGELQNKMGRNLMLFQNIEHALKMVLPYIHPDGSHKSGLDTFNSFKEAIKTNTLGQLIGAYRKSVDVSAEGLTAEEVRDICAQELKDLVDSRNTLVHGFFELPGISTLTAQGLENGLRYLDDQYRHAQALYRDISPQVLMLIKVFLANGTSRNEELQQLHDLLDKHVASYATINVRADSSSPDWVNAEIVKLLELAQSATETVDGWTHLGRAGKFIKSQNPEIAPKDYGLKSLKDVLVTSGLFDIREDGSAIFYKSKEFYIEIQHCA